MTTTALPISASLLPWKNHDDDQMEEGEVDDDNNTSSNDKGRAIEKRVSSCSMHSYHRSERQETYCGRKRPRSPASNNILVSSNRHTTTCSRRPKSEPCSASTRFHVTTTVTAPLRRQSNTASHSRSSLPPHRTTTASATTTASITTTTLSNNSSSNNNKDQYSSSSHSNKSCNDNRMCLNYPSSRLNPHPSQRTQSGKCLQAIRDRDNFKTNLHNRQHQQNPLARRGDWRSQQPDRRGREELHHRQDQTQRYATAANAGARDRSPSQSNLKHFREQSPDPRERRTASTGDDSGLQSSSFQQRFPSSRNSRDQSIDRSSTSSSSSSLMFTNNNRNRNYSNNSNNRIHSQQLYPLDRNHSRYSHPASMTANTVRDSQQRHPKHQFHSEQSNSGISFSEMSRRRPSPPPADREFRRFMDVEPSQAYRRQQSWTSTSQDSRTSMSIGEGKRHDHFHYRNVDRSRSAVDDRSFPRNRNVGDLDRNSSIRSANYFNAENSTGEEKRNAQAFRSRGIFQRREQEQMGSSLYVPPTQNCNESQRRHEYNSSTGRLHDQRESMQLNNRRSRSPSSCRLGIRFSPPSHGSDREVVQVSDNFPPAMAPQLTRALPTSGDTKTSQDGFDLRPVTLLETPKLSPNNNLDSRPLVEPKGSLTVASLNNVNQPSEPMGSAALSSSQLTLTQACRTQRNSFKPRPVTGPSSPLLSPHSDSIMRPTKTVTAQVKIPSLDSECSVPQPHHTTANQNMASERTSGDSPENVTQPHRIVVQTLNDKNAPKNKRSIELVGARDPVQANVQTTAQEANRLERHNDRSKQKKCGLPIDSLPVKVATSEEKFSADRQKVQSTEATRSSISEKPNIIPMTEMKRHKKDTQASLSTSTDVSKSSIGIPMRWLKPRQRPLKKRLTDKRAYQSDAIDGRVAKKACTATVQTTASNDISSEKKSSTEIGTGPSRSKQETLTTASKKLSSVIKGLRVNKVSKRPTSPVINRSVTDSEGGSTVSNSRDLVSKDYENERYQEQQVPVSILATVSESNKTKNFSSVHGGDNPIIRCKKTHRTEPGGATPDLATDDSLTASTVERAPATNVPSIIVHEDESSGDIEDYGFIDSPDSKTRTRIGTTNIAGGIRSDYDGIALFNENNERKTLDSRFDRHAIESSSSSSDSSSDESDTDEEELMMWAAKMFGTAPNPIARPKSRAEGALVESRGQTKTSKGPVLHLRLSPMKPRDDKNCSSIQTGPNSREDSSNLDPSKPMADTSERALTDSFAKMIKRKRKKMKKMRRAQSENVEVDQTEEYDPEKARIEMEELKRKKESAKPLTAAQIREILAEDTTSATGRQNWVRRSVRQPSKSLLGSKLAVLLFDQLRSNHPDVKVLKMKKYINDPDAPTVVLDAVLDALEENTNCEALFIQNFNQGMRDKQVLHLLRILQQPTCNIWCLNIGETYNVTDDTWEAFTKGLRRTKVTHMYASEHTITTEMKDEIRDTIRKNRSKHDMHINPNNLDVIIQCTHCWWNPINAKVLRPYLKKSGYEHMLHDREWQGLRGSSSAAPVE